MLRVITGPFHPDLELALVQEIRQLKTDDPLVPVAIVVPSSLLLQRVRELLILEHGLSLLNVHFLTFHQLALRLRDEWQDSAQGLHANVLPEIMPDLFFEQLLGELAERSLPGCETLRLRELPPGARRALWATIRDLNDAMVEPAVALRGVAEGQFAAEDGPVLAALFTLQAAAAEASLALGVRTMDDVAAQAAAAAATSRFLSGLHRVCYYGFYDLTQVQLTLFEAVCRRAPTTLYFPLVPGPDFEFARRFFERHMARLQVSPPVSVPRAEAVGSGPGTSSPVRPRIMSTVGPEDELTLACKEILLLVETHGYRFDEIGVIARTLEPYADSLRRTFDQHRIPFASTAGLSVIRHPVAKTLLQLAALRLTGFYRATMMDVVASPFYRAGPEADAVEPRPHLWQLAVRALGITRGEEEWRRLAQAARVEVWAGEQEEDDEDGRRIGVERDQLQVLWKRVSRLLRDCLALPAEGGFAELTDAFEELISGHLSVPGLTDASDGRAGDEGDPERVGAAVRAALQTLRSLDRIGVRLGWREWVRTFTHAIEDTTVPVGPTEHPGVQVLDAMSARGLPFRALFVLGLNENVFPRVIREDAFLRDRSRRVLEETLGYKIGEKLPGYDEERLLFALLAQAARERLYLLYQRADRDGRPLALSPYLAERLPAGAGENSPEDVRLRRRFSDRVALPQFAPAFQTREEWTFGLVLEGRDPVPVLDAVGRGAELFRAGVRTLRALEGEARAPGAFDGLTGPLESHWSRLLARGLAPTPLETYARCPFQYFAAHALKLEPFREPVGAEVPPLAIGEVCHAAMARLYPALLERGWPEQDLEPASFDALVASVTAEACRDYAARQGGGYALLWELTREMIVSVVTEAVRADREDCLASGFRPVRFEVEAEGTLDAEQVSGLAPVKVRGRLDRVDRRARPVAWRIVDIKYRHGGKMQPKDRDLLLAGVRGFRLQPPLYACMRQAGDQERDQPPAHPEPPERVEFLFLAPRWEERVARRAFQTAAWASPGGREISETLTLLLDGIKAGRFFVLPDTYCDQCDFSAACRRWHGPTWLRSHWSEVAKALRERRKQKVSADGDA